MSRWPLVIGSKLPG